MVLSQSQIELNESQKAVLQKYVINGETTWEEVAQRVAHFVASAEPTPELQRAWQEKFLSILLPMKFVPGGSILANSSHGTRGLLNCFVLSAEDNIYDITKLVSDAVLTTKFRGGVGINIGSQGQKGHIRSKGAPFQDGLALGPCSVLDMVSDCAKKITTGNKCFAEGTLLNTEKGYRKVEDVVAGDGSQVCTHKGFAPITERFDNGQAEVFRVTTQKGYSVEVTANHKMAVLDENGDLVLKELQSLGVGDDLLLLLGKNLVQEYVKLRHISSKINTCGNFVKQPNDLDESLAYLIGYSYGDGSISRGKTYNFLNLAVGHKYPNVKDHLISIVQEKFGLEAKVHPGCGAVWNIRIHSSKLLDWLKANNLSKEKANHIKVPQAILESPSSVVGAFLSGYFDADGCARGGKGGYGMDSVSQEFLQTVQLLLLAEGIISKLHKSDRTKQGWQTIYRLNICGSEFKRRFQSLCCMSAKVVGSPMVFGRDGVGGYPLALKRGAYYQRLLATNNLVIPYTTMLKLIESTKAFGSLDVAESLSQHINYFPDKIGSIELIGVKRVFDIEVEDVHLLSGNGIYTSNSRRGAFLFSMDWRHPDIWEFIQAKTQSTIDAATVKMIAEQIAQLVLSDLSDSQKRQQLRELKNQLATAWVETHLSPEGKRDRRWHNANISVQLDDEFFERLDQKDEQANKLWNKVAQYAHDTADPGLLLVDNAKRRSPIRDFVTCTNPCITADTWIHTGEGPRQVKDLIDVQHSTYINGELFSTTPNGFFSTGVKPVLSLQTKEGFRLRLTGNHQVLKVTAQTRRRQYTEWIAAEDLRPDDKILIHDHRDLLPWSGHGSAEEGWLLGSLVGDGCFGFHKGKEVAHLRFWEAGSDELLAHAVALTNEHAHSGRTVSGHIHVQHQYRELSSIGIAGLAQTYGITKGNKQITPQVEQASFEFYQGFLRGLFDADGSVQGTQEKGVSIRLSQSNLPLLEAVQRMLLRMGIASKIYKNRREAGERLLPNSKRRLESFYCKAQHELMIANDNIQSFQALIGFQHSQKAAKLQKLSLGYLRSVNRERFSVTVEFLEADGVEEVYDCTVPGPSRFDANGLVVHNCGEIFLPPNSACNLGSIVVTKFVSRSPNGEISIDWEGLAETTAIATRFLDNVLDISEFATPDQKHNVRHVFRQLGLGIMGWADYLKLARIPYDSVEHLSEIDRWGSWIAQHTYRTSEAIAAEKGTCGIWEQIKAVRTGNPFEQWVDSEGNRYNGAEALHSKRQDLEQIPRRNSTVLSIAPTGSIAQLAACSWAFEPDFGLTVWKQVFVDASKNQQNWVQILNPYLDELHLSESDSEIVKRNGSLKGTHFAKDHPDVAQSFKIAREIPSGWHILVQSKWQDWIDSSISKTINLPARATVAEIKDIYRLAQKAGLKGVTIYRSGTLDSEPIKVGNEEKQ